MIEINIFFILKSFEITAYLQIYKKTAPIHPKSDAIVQFCVLLFPLVFSLFGFITYKHPKLKYFWKHKTLLPAFTGRNIQN